MDNLPLVTIITPSYNQGNFIEETIKSVLYQDYPNIEYIIVDGGSTDDTLEILEKYKNKLKWISEKDNGQSDAINKGFRMAKGEIVAWLNSDDTYELGAVSTAVQYFVRDEHLGLLYGEGDIIDEFGNKVKRFEATQSFDLWTLVNVWDYIMQPTTFFRRDLVEQIGYLDEKLYWCMDWDLWIKLASISKVQYIDSVLANSREYSDTKTSTGGWKRFNEIVYIMRKYGKRRFPYGYFLYGASTMYTIYSKNNFLRLIFQWVLYVTHKSVFSMLPIMYKDNWTKNKLELLVPNFNKLLNLHVQNLLPRNTNNHIKIYVNNEILITENINLDSKNIIIPLPIKNKSNIYDFHHVKLQVSKTSRPVKWGLFGDKRKLGVLIRDIKYQLTKDSKM